MRPPSEDWCREVILGRTVRVCELCRSAEWTDKAHRLARSQGGKWLPDNILGLCVRCHGWCHAQPELAKLGGWVTTNPQPGEDPVWLASLSLWPGWYFLDALGSPVPWCVPALPTPQLPPAFPPHMPASIVPPRPIVVPRQGQRRST